MAATPARMPAPTCGPARGSPTSATCRATGSLGCPSWPGWSSPSRPRRRCRSGSPQQIAEWLNQNLKPRGVGVVLEAEHTCMTLRGVQAQGTRLMTSPLLGQLRNEATARGRILRSHGCRPHLNSSPRSNERGVMLTGAKWVWPCDRDGTALAHNGDLTNTGPARPTSDRSLKEAILRAMPRLAGAFSPGDLPGGAGERVGGRCLGIWDPHAVFHRQHLAKLAASGLTCSSDWANLSQKSAEIIPSGKDSPNARPDSWLQARRSADACGALGGNAPLGVGVRSPLVTHAAPR
jgi:hypothetical protein